MNIANDRITLNGIEIYLPGILDFGLHFPGTKDRRRMSDDNTMKKMLDVLDGKVKHAPDRDYLHVSTYHGDLYIFYEDEIDIIATHKAIADYLQARKR